MCGICGILSSQPADLALLAAQTTSIAHREPDGAGYWHADQVALGHRRLAIIDLATGDQPLGNEDGSIQVVFNGEIYNYQALRAELIALGHCFRTDGDTEVIAHAVEQWGDAALSRLDGMFAFALWDARRERLLLVRDRVGKKPLYYAALPAGGVVFGSEIKALLAHPAVDRTLDDAALPAYLCYGHVPAPATWYRAIRQLPPAHALSWTTGVEREWCWWDGAWVASQPRLNLSTRDASTELRRLVRQAVERRLISDVPLGAFLSGGLDSSIVVAEMQACLGQPVETFSMGFSGDAWFDETPYARLVAQQLGTKHHEFIVDPAAFDLVATLVRHYDEPFADSSALPTYLLSQMTRQHVTVALSGDGGDELFAGYERFGAGLWTTRYGQLPATIRHTLESSVNRLPHRSATTPIARAQRILSKMALPLAEGFPRWLMLWTPAEIALLLGEAAVVVPAPDQRFSATTQGISDPMAALLWYNLHTYLPDDLLVKTDRMSMAHGLEVRSPFLDTALLEWGLRLPQHLQWRGRRGKWLLRHAYRNVLPKAILNRPKHGFGVPLDAWFRGALRPLVQETLLAPDAQVRNWLDQNAIQRICDQHWDGRRNAGHHLWALLTLETWLRQQQSIDVPATMIEVQ